SAAKIAYSWGWHDRAIAAIGKTKNLNDVEIRFPLVYKDIIDNYSKKYKIDSAWTYAIIRRESIFINDAKSHKGALGLMQLLPRTARATARAIKTSYQGTRQLIKIKPNIRLGTHYLKSLFRKHKQQTVLATAAYNAGPSNVRKWLPENKPMDAIRWIESIPFKETREYVTNVLAYNIIYQFRMGLNKQTQLSQLMPPIPAKI
ncbi:MAG: transglycosylase SLT domain-containing protein, partial [Gammaproteobacteria bacterium]|nr:transglycosylase SLT domain-containing protein [Gammaproteobacteria bacterium]